MFGFVFDIINIFPIADNNNVVCVKLEILSALFVSYFYALQEDAVSIGAKNGDKF